jgi:hypothetical protein
MQIFNKNLLREGQTREDKKKKKKKKKKKVLLPRQNGKQKN